MEGPNTDMNSNSGLDTLEIDGDTNREIVVHLSKQVLKWVCALILLIILIAILAWNGSTSARNVDRWRVEVKIVEKDTVIRKDDTIGGEAVYVLKGEGEDGSLYTFEITDAALEGRFDAATAFEQIQMNKYYMLTVGWRDKRVAGKNGYSPNVYGAKKLLNGFETEPGL